MKLNSLSVLCLSLLLFHTPVSLAKGKIGGGKSAKKIPTSNRGTHTNTNTVNKNNQGSSSTSSGQNNRGGSPPHSGSYPKQQGGGSYHQPYPGGYINQNPNNKILSPHYGHSFGKYGGYGARGSSPFSRSVQERGYSPTYKSKGFGRTAVMAAAGGAAVGMVVGYRLGRLPYPHFRNSQEEYYYKHYMHRKYSAGSTDTNDYRRDNTHSTYSQPPDNYNKYMDSCMKRKDILSEDSQKPKKNPSVTTTTTTTTTVTAVVTSASDNDTGSNTSVTNSTSAQNSVTAGPLTPRPLNDPSPVPPASQAASSAEDDDTVSVVEIGYPALIEQLKVRKCVELYIEHIDQDLKKPLGGVQGLEMGLQRLLPVVTSTILMLLNNNMLMLLH